MTSDDKITSIIVERLKNLNTVPAFTTNDGSNQPCNICLKNVHRNQKSKLCCNCGQLIHMKCTLPCEFESSPGNWICLYCTIHNNSKIFPFTLEPDELLQEINCFDLPSLTDSMPSFEISSKLTKPHKHVLS